MRIEQSPALIAVLAPTSPVRARGPVASVAGAGAVGDIPTAGTDPDPKQGPPPPASDPIDPSLALGTGGGITGLSEALYRLRCNWSPASHQGKSAIVALPRPDVIAAYHRDDMPPLARPERASDFAPHPRNPSPVRGRNGGVDGH